MINEETIKLLNYRIQQEEYSSRIYHYFALCLENMGYENAPKLWQKYSDEEMEHAEWAKNYLLSYGVTPELKEIPKPECNCSSLIDVISETYKHEEMITKQCNDLAIAAIKMNNHILYQLAIRYCKEQLEELNKAQTLVDKLDTYGGDKIALKMIDNDLKSLL
jgi:ferritin